jgi:uncharacterized protein (TIGR02588 family)
MSKMPKPQIEVQEPHWIEWATGLVSALMVLALIGWVTFDAVTKEQAPPDFTIEAQTAELISGGYRVRFEVTNSATTTAAGVTVRGEIRDGDSVVEDAEVVFDYVAAESKASGALIFARDPGSQQLQLRAVGYTDP